MDLNLRTYRPRLAHSRGGPTGFRRLLTALMAVAIALPMAVAPAFATSVTAGAPLVSPAGTGLTAQYDVPFTPAATTVPTSVTVNFPLGTTIASTTIPSGGITVAAALNCSTSPVATTAAITATAATATAGPIVVITSTALPATTLTAGATCVRFLPNAGIKNPTIANNYTLTVATSADTTAATSGLYQIFTAGAGGSLTGTINTLPPAILSVTLSQPTSGFANCASGPGALANLTNSNGNAAPATGLPNNGNGACQSGGFDVNVNTSVPATLYVSAGGTAAPIAPSTGTGWALVSPGTITNPNVAAGSVAALPPTDKFALALGSLSSTPTATFVTPRLALTSAPVIDSNVAAAAVTAAANTGGTVVSNCATAAVGCVAAPLIVREAATILGPLASSSGASSNPTTGFTTSITWLVIANG